MALLSPYRVVDLADERGLICGQILADLGADVIAIEPPAGNSARRMGPFAGDAKDVPDASLTWAAYARNKRSAIIDLDTGDGREQLRDLCRTADFLVESLGPGDMDSLGLGYETFKANNPGLVYVSISAFGAGGPKANYAATDLTVMAAAGPMAVSGDDDRAPVRVGSPQAFLHAGAEAAVAALVAHRERVRSGLGQHVDLSAQQAVAIAMQSFAVATAIGEANWERVTNGAAVAGINIPFVWRAKDGHVSLTFFFGSAIGPFSKRLIDWMYEEGACDESIRGKDWIGYLGLLIGGDEPIEEFHRVLAAIDAFFQQRTKQELLEAAMEKRLLIVPIATLSDLDGSPQLEARDYWQTLETPSLGAKVKTPGPFAKLSATPIVYGTGAPHIGQHTNEVLASTSLSRVPAAAGGEPPLEEALSGLKILDFMWVMAGPSSTRILADHGATVIKVESTTHIDTARSLQPFKNGTAGPESSGLYHNMNAGKFGLTLNLSTEAGREVAKDLARWADAVCESFSPRAMRAWGLDYQSLKEVNPSVVMMSSCLFGQYGPYSEIAGFGTMGAAVGGFNSATGWPDRGPSMLGAYTDYVSPRFAAAALLSALDHKERTGEGQYIDLAQAEASLHFLSPVLFDLAINGRDFTRLGNSDPQLSPHGVFPTAGEDRWVAVACRDQADWDALGGPPGLDQLGNDARFTTLAGRLEHRQQLEEEISKWTCQRTMGEVEALLQSRGVPAHQVQNSPELFADQQLHHRGHFREVPHAELGSMTVEGPRFRLSRTPGRVERAGPMFGEHNDFVLREILGYSDDRIAALVLEDVLT